MTHDYLLILPVKANATKDDTSMSHDQLKQEALRTLHLAKNATLYAVSAISIAESSRKAHGRALKVTYESTRGLGRSKPPESQ